MGLRNSIIYLAKNIKLDKDYRSVLNYDESSLISLITSSSNLVYSSSNYSYLRDTGTIQVNASYATVCQANYMAFKNQDYANKWFFAFIDDIVYKGDSCTEIKYTIDVWSTWYSYWSPTSCFVVREHVVDDSLGANTIPEQVETGEYIVNAHLYDARNQVTTLVMGTNYHPNDPIKLWGGTYNGIPSGVCYVCVHDIDDLKDILSYYESQGVVDTVSSLFVAPTWLTDGDSTGLIPESSTPGTYTLGVSRISSLNGYTPVNKKLLTYPYCYILMTNGAGASAVFHQELWTVNSQTNDMELQVKGVLTPGCSIRAYPINYNGDDFGVDYGLTLGKFPQLNWSTDQYINWLTQNGTNIFVSALSSAVAIGTGVVSGNPIAVGSGIVSATSTISEIERHAMEPPQMRGNLNSGDVATALDLLCFKTYRMTIKREFAEVIDKYFTKVGYKVNKIKVPNMSHRQNYNFVQIGAEDNVAIANNYNNICPPASDLNEINNLFRRGITIWNNHNNLGNYSVTNNITQ